MLTREFFREYQILPDPRWESGLGRAFDAMMALTRTRVVFEGAERLPATPAILATSSSQQYDFLPFRAELRRRGIKAVTATEGKHYQHRISAHLLARTGVVPLASRGYLVDADFVAVLQRRPTEEEHRALCTHLDEGTPLPEGEPYRTLTTRSRRILGHEVMPQAEPYRDALRRLSLATMSESLRLCREAVAAGFHLQLDPETAVQFAHALGLPIVPVGMSGCREAFRGTGMTLRGGTITCRFGEPLPPPALPQGFRPFHADDERLHRDALLAATATILDALDPLLDEGYRSTRRSL